MSEPVQIAIGLLFLLGVFVLTRYVVSWKMSSATGTIVKDLERQAALDPFTAVALPYCEVNPLRIGMRNYHAKAIEYMVSEGVVGRTASGKYYLRAHGALKPDKPADPGE